MGKSADNIYMNYQAMKQRASRLEELADELKRIAENEIACHASDRSSWTGDSGDVCREKLTRLEKNVNKRAKELENAAKSLRTVAERQYKLEMMLVSIVS